MISAGSSLASAASTPAPATGPGPVPVAGSYAFDFAQSGSDGAAVGVVNAVRRVPGGTIVYVSFGVPRGASPPRVTSNSLVQISIGNYAGSALPVADLVDPVGLQRYRPMVASGGCLCSSLYDLPQQIVPGHLYAGYVVVPPLPATVRTVTVLGFFGAAVSNVPVGNGALTPVAPGGKTVTDLSTGWPTVPLDRVAATSNRATFVLPLTARSASLDNSERTSKTARRVDVDLASDVLFAVDRSQLTAAAQSKIAGIAADIVRRANGPVTVSGYTDSTGSPGHNLTLSRARAASVLAALRQAVGDAAVTFTSSGHGESAPVASNATAAGRALNRRVSIGYAVRPGG
jgi:outer membrane protein OmpA-like peptidoglycan-associated protein